MHPVKKYLLNEKQKREIRLLLKIPKDNEEFVFDDLEHRMNTDSWLVFDSDGKVTKKKKFAQIARDLTSLSKSLGGLEKSLRKIDPLVLSHLNDEFSFLYFKMSQGASLPKEINRPVISFKELISKTRSWASRANERITEDVGGSYFQRFFNEIEDFWLWNVSEVEVLPNTRFRKLIAILSDSDDDTVKKQLMRWKAMANRDKSAK